jgi:HEAT repeat protein
VDEKWEQLADLGRAALPALEAALDGYYPETAIATAKVCGELKAVRTIPALGEQLDQIGLTSSESHEREGALKVINAVAEALGMIGDEDALPFLEGALKHWKSEVKIAAAKALGEMGPAAIPILEGALEQEKPWNSWVRGAITEALERIQSRQPLPQTEVPLLEADNLSVGAIAAHVLRETEEKVPVPVARKAKEKE